GVKLPCQCGLTTHRNRDALRNADQSADSLSKCLVEGLQSVESTAEHTQQSSQGYRERSERAAPCQCLVGCNRDISHLLALRRSTLTVIGTIRANPRLHWRS